MYTYTLYIHVMSGTMDYSGVWVIILVTTTERSFDPNSFGWNQQSKNWRPVELCRLDLGVIVLEFI